MRSCPNTHNILKKGESGMMRPELTITLAESAPDSAPFLLRGPLAANMGVAADMGYDAVELHAADPALLPREAIFQASETHGIGVASLGTGMMAGGEGLTLVHDDPERQAAAAARMQRFIELGAELGAVVIVGLVRGLIRDVGSRTAYFDRLTPALESLIDHAEANDATLVLEAVNRYEGDVFNTVDETLDYIESFASDRLKLHADSFHMNIEETNPAESLRRAGARLGHLHVADSNRLAPGDGHMDFAAITAALRDIGYKGAISVECLPHPGPKDAARRAISTLRPLL